MKKKHICLYGQLSLAISLCLLCRKPQGGTCQEGPLEGHMDRVTIEEFLRTLRNSLELGVTNMLEALND